MNIKEIHKIVGGIKSNLFKKSNSYSIGMLKSHFRGRGLQFKEHRIYDHGDDIRFIDWKILAKTGIPHLKTFDEERNIEIVVVIDASPTMLNGYNGISKLQASIELCCLLYMLSQETKDLVHTLILADEIINIPKKSGEDGIAHLISKLRNKEIISNDGTINLNYTPTTAPTDEQKNLSINKHLSKKREIVIFSDFIDFLDIKYLKKLLIRNNLHCFRLISPLDEASQLPYSLYCKSNLKQKNGKFAKLKFAGKENIKDLLGKHITHLKVHDRYLDSFVRKML